MSEMKDEKTFRNISLIIISVEALFVFASFFLTMLEDVRMLPYLDLSDGAKEYYYEILIRIFFFSGICLMTGIALLISCYSKIIFRVLLALQTIYCINITYEMIDYDLYELETILSVLLILLPHFVYFAAYFIRRKSKDPVL